MMSGLNYLVVTAKLPDWCYMKRGKVFPKARCRVRITGIATVVYTKDRWDWKEGRINEG